MREGIFLPGSRRAVWMMSVRRVKLQPGHPACSTIALPEAVCLPHADPHTMALTSSSPAVMPAPGPWGPGHPCQGPQVCTAPRKSCAVTYTHQGTGGRHWLHHHARPLPTPAAKLRKAVWEAHEVRMEGHLSISVTEDQTRPPYKHGYFSCSSPVET